MNFLGLFGSSPEERAQTRGAIVKQARRWFWRTGFYRENNEKHYKRMANGELRRWDLEPWRGFQQQRGDADTRRELRRQKHVKVRVNKAKVRAMKRRKV